MGRAITAVAETTGESAVGGGQGRSPERRFRILERTLVHLQLGDLGPSRPVGAGFVTISPSPERTKCGRADDSAVQDGLVAIFPNLAQGAALRQLGMLRTDELPMLAAQWLVELDSPALRRLAGLDRSDGWLIDQVWFDALSELGVTAVVGEKAWNLAITFQVAAWRAGDRATLDVLRQVVRAYIDNDYPPYAPEAGRLDGLDDELDSGWGRSREQVVTEIEETLAEWSARLTAGRDG